MEKELTDAQTEVKAILKLPDKDFQYKQLG